MVRTPHRFRRLAALAASVAGIALVPALAAPASATTSGVNDWSCTPSAAHPRPVVLWHGLGSNGPTDMGSDAQFLAQKGYCTYYTTYGTTYYGPYTGGLASMRTSAAELGGFVDQVRQAAGTATVDIVGHSEGTTVPAYYLKVLGGSAKVTNFVGFGSNFKGTTLGGLQTLADVTGFRPILDAGGCTACNEFAPDSSFIADLNAGGVTVPGTSYTSIVTKYDEAVNPYTSGVLAPAANVHNITLQDVCPLDFSGHVALAVDPNVQALIANALDPAHATPVPCIPMPWVS
ncbi:lipase [Nocardioides phosphati]|uniref:Lipase n=1 Tax=Nocardioides phosphati TaxID=1867775 RepID=A0ABQ2NAK1_9ACTN|nr:lipase [Nocardioides phosphati]GGO88752.1 lipase [Nocardioides phosphati]